MDFSLGEINVICTDLEQSIAFYRDVCGFEQGEYEGGGCHMRCGPHEILLLGVAASRATPTPYCSQPAISFDLRVNDIAAAYAHFQTHGATIDMAWEPGQPSFHVRDPDGLVLEIVSWPH